MSMNAVEILRGQGYTVDEQPGSRAGRTRYVVHTDEGHPCPACLVNLGQHKAHADNARGQVQAYPAFRAEATAVWCHGAGGTATLESLRTHFGVPTGRDEDLPRKAPSVDAYLRKRGIPLRGSDWRAWLSMGPWIDRDGYESDRLWGVRFHRPDGKFFQRMLVPHPKSGTRLGTWQPKGGDGPATPWGGRNRDLKDPHESAEAPGEVLVVYLTEGHEDALCLTNAAGATAYTTGGVTTFGAGHLRWLLERHPKLRKVRVAFDNDDGGRRGVRHVRDVLSTAPGVGVEWLTWPAGTPEGYDVNRLLQDQPADFARLVTQGLEWRDSNRESMEVLTTPGIDVGGWPMAFGFGELGDARRFVHDHGEDVRYVQDEENWYTWTGTHWSIADKSRIIGMAESTIGRMHEVAAKGLAEGSNPDYYRSLKESAKRLGNLRPIKSMLELASAQAKVVTTHKTFHAGRGLLNCRNGTVELATGALRPHAREDRLTHLVDVDYDREAVAPEWDRFLEFCTSGDDKVAEYLRRAVGYTISGDASQQVFFVLWGRGANGKTVFLEALHRILGTDPHQGLSGTLPRESLMAKAWGDSVPADLAACSSRRFVVCSELPKRGEIDESRLKAITGQETLSVRFYRQGWFQMQVRFTLWIASNFKPHTKTQEDGFWRRYVQVDFLNQVDPERRDPDLLERLTTTEAPGILAWMVAGAYDFLTVHGRRLDPPDSVIAAGKAHRQDSDELAEFLEEYFIVMSEDEAAKYPGGLDARPSVSGVFAAYEEWALGEGVRHPLGRNTLSAALRQEYGLPTRHGGHGNRPRFTTLRWKGHLSTSDYEDPARRRAGRSH